MHAILKEAGVNAGLFTSPHLVHFGERIRDTQRLMSAQEIEDGITRIRGLVRDWDPHPTFFEIAFVLALEWFAMRECPWVVLETGMGGRLDATNAITPAVSVITPIGWDHMQFLGDTLAKIASEKAGIIKHGVPAVFSMQETEVMEVLVTTARERESPFTVVDAPCTMELGLTGPHQQWNAALALAGLRAAGFELPAEVIRSGLRAVEWPARFQTLRPGVILDGAHNLDSARALTAAWNARFPGQKAVILFGAVAGKDIGAVLRELAPIASSWHLTHFDSPRALGVEELTSCLKHAVPDAQEVRTHAELSSALTATQDVTPLLITGSLYLAGEVLARTGGDGGAYQRSHQ
jgi:dihydrofolate synthase/folylpolyglutamate synthase